MFDFAEDKSLPFFWYLLILKIGFRLHEQFFQTEYHRKKFRFALNK